jgi:hypothetical protein
MEEVSRLCICVLLFVDINVGSVNVCCVCAILSCVLIHTLTHDLHTHISCKITVQSIFITLRFNTFLTLCCCTSQSCLARVTKYCPFKIYNVWLLCVNNIFKYKSSDVCVEVSLSLVVLLWSLTSAVPVTCVININVDLINYVHTTSQQHNQHSHDNLEDET